MGYGLAKSWLSGRPWAVFPFYIVAVAMHAAFNLFSTLADDAARANNAAGSAIAFLAAVSLAIVAISVVRLKLVSRRSPTSPEPGFHRSKSYLLHALAAGHMRF